LFLKKTIKYYSYKWHTSWHNGAAMLVLVTSVHSLYMAGSNHRIFR